MRLSQALTRLGVLGWPVAHSRSPAMHRAALRELGLDDWAYQLLPVPPELFAETVRALEGAGFAGANVTIPHKEDALAIATEATPAAAAIGAANTLSFSGGAIHADNTDAPGTLAALRDAGVDPSAPGTTAVVLGAGGSARAVVWALRGAGADVAIWNRTAARAEELADELDVRATTSAPSADTTILVNCTSVGLHDPDATFKELPVAADALRSTRCVVDLVYRPGGTPLVRAALAAGCTVVDGMEILVQQGALSFERWTGRPAPLDAMRRGARGSEHGRTDDG